MDVNKPFDHAGLKDWYNKVTAKGGKVSIGVQFPGGKYAILGDPENGKKHF